MRIRRIASAAAAKKWSREEKPGVRGQESGARLAVADSSPLTPDL
jgi:hypothetical protein